MTISETTTNAVANPGVLSTNPPNIIIALRAPTVNDTNANIGDEWCNKITSPYTFWKLSYLFGGQAIWQQFLGPNQIQSVAVDTSTPPGTDPVVPLNGQITVTGGQVAAGTTTNVIQTDSLAANTFTIQIQRAQAVASTTIGDNGVSHFNSADFTVDANGFVSLISVGGVTSVTGTTHEITASPTTGAVVLSLPTTLIAPGTFAAVTSVSSPEYQLTGSSSGTISILPQANAGTYNFNMPITAGTSGYFLTSAGGGGSAMTWTNPTGIGLQTLSDDIGTSITPSSNNIQLVGHVVEQGATKFSTVDAGSHLANINPMSSARWIVDPLGFNGTHTTIAAALAAATSGDTILLLPGTYTENPTLVAGVNLTAQSGDQLTPIVTIVGKCTFTGAGTVTISNIQLQTNSDYFLAVTGSSASIVNLENCYLNCLNNTGISFTSSSSSASIFIHNCLGTLGTTGIALFSFSSSGNSYILNSRFTNDGGSSTASSISAAILTVQESSFSFPMATSSSGVINMARCNLTTSGSNLTSLTTAGTGSSSFNLCTFAAGSASAISIGAGTTVSLYNCDVQSSNTNAITGSGTLDYSGITFSSSSGINVTTQNPIPHTVQQGGTFASTFTAYMPVCGGTTTTGALQSVTTGTGGYVLTYNSSSSLPTWQSIGALSVAYTNVSSSPYTVLSTDYYLSVDCSGGAITLNFPNAPTANQRWIVKDRTGSAHTHNITLTTPGGTVTFDGSTSYVMATNYQAIDLIANSGPNYEIF